MRLSYTAEKIAIEFEPDDWDDHKGGTIKIMEAIKDRIGPGEYGFDYDPSKHLWIVDKNAFNRAVLKKLFEFYLTRPPTNLQF